MNVERFHAIVRALKSELEETAEASLLEQLANATQQLSANPAQEPTQQQVSQLRRELNQALRGADSNSFSPAWREAVDELGVSDLLGEALAEELERVFSRNEITPATAADEINAMKQRVDALVQALDEASSGLEFFRIGAEELNPGEFEIGFLIPRREVRDGLESLGKELMQLKRLLGPFTELAGEGRPDIRVRSLSSSEFQVFLDSTQAVALMVATALERLLAAYERILNIRQKRKELAEEEDVPDEVLEPLTGHANQVMQKEIELIVDEIILSAKQADQGRLNELRHDLTLSLNALAMRVDLGYNVEVRAGELPPPPDEEADLEDSIHPETRSATEAIRSKQKSLEFMNVSGKPILSLEQPEEALEDEK
jgi:HAMP domain-containing protein